MATDDEEALASVAERIEQVRARFVAGLEDRVEALCEIARRTGSPDATLRRKAFDDLRLGLHNLSGAAPTLGLGGIGHRASAIEKRVIAARSKGEPLDAGSIGELVRDIAAVVREAR